MTTATISPSVTDSGTGTTSWPWEVTGKDRTARIKRLRTQINKDRYTVAVDDVAAAVLAAVAMSRQSRPDDPRLPIARSRIERLVREHLHIVDEVVSRVSANFPRHVERDELLDAGRLGLVEAARRYDPSLGVPFDRYAAIRIRGAVLDSTRTRDWVSRSVRRGARELAEVEQELTARKGRRPRSTELAEALGVTPERVTKMRADAASSMLLSLDFEGDDTSAAVERIPDDAIHTTPEASLERREMLGTLREAVAELPGAHGMVVRRYYFGGDLLQDIAADLGVTEARVSQINSEAVAALRRYFTSLYEGVPDVDERFPGKRTRAAFLERLTERSTWRTRLAAADAGSNVGVDLRDPDKVEVRLK